MGEYKRLRVGTGDNGRPRKTKIPQDGKGDHWRPQVGTRGYRRILETMADQERVWEGTLG